MRTVGTAEWNEQPKIPNHFYLFVWGIARIRADFFSQKWNLLKLLDYTQAKSWWSWRVTMAFTFFWEDGWSIARFWRVLKYKVRMWYLSHNPICYAALPMHCWMFPISSDVYMFFIYSKSNCATFNLTVKYYIASFCCIVPRAYGAWRDDTADVKPQRIPRQAWSETQISFRETQIFHHANCDDIFVCQ